MAQRLAAIAPKDGYLHQLFASFQHVGGYQPCQKWLKDRKERTLSDGGTLPTLKIVVSLKETIEIMKKIDKSIPNFPMQ